MPTILLRARRAAAERFSLIAVKWTPADVHVSFRRHLTGCAWAQSRKISVPRPRTRRALHIYLHEIAHVVLEHFHSKPEYLQEYEAELWAFAVMRAEGISIPAKSIERAANYVRYLIHEAETHGATVNYAEIDFDKFSPANYRHHPSQQAA
jgi:hypothetical protein